MAMFDYEAPIKIIMQEMQARRENQVYQAIQNIGVDVDKEELLKALSYDRNQYEKGYRAAKSEIVHCKDCKYAKKSYVVLGVPDYSCLKTGITCLDADDFCSYGERKDEE